MLGIFTVLLLIFIAVAIGDVSYEQVFFTEVTSDGIAFTSVTVPAGLQTIVLRLAALPAAFTPKLLMRKDGVPSETVFDAQFDIPSMPGSLLLVERSPAPCVLHFGIFGGDLLHSHRYFAGSPVSTVVGLWTTRTPLSAPPLHSLVALPLNTSSSFAVRIGSAVSRWTLTAAANLTDGSACTSSGVLEMAMSRGGSTPEEVQAVPVSCSMPAAELSLDRPAPGTWTLRLSWHPQGGASAVALPQGWRVSRHRDAHLTAVADLHTLRSADFLSQPATSSGVQQRTSSGVLPLLQLTISTACTPEEVAVVDMDISTAGELTYSGTVPSASAVALRAPLLGPLRFALFRGMGGALSLQLTATCPTAADTPEEVLVSYRVGGLPVGPRPSPLNLSSTSSGVSVTRTPLVVGEQTTFAWPALQRPLLPDLLVTAADGLYLTVTVHPSASASASACAYSLTLSFPLCEEFCVHGRCTSSAGDVDASACACRYPYAGERCDALALPLTAYALQVLLLVSSNLSALPAVLMACAAELYLPAMGMALSMTASAVYHLCDTDALCLLPFEALQVCDVLLSVTMIFIVLLLHAPLSLRTHSALSLACMAVLLPWVAASPTSAANVIAAVAAAAGALVVGHAALHAKGLRVMGVDYSLLAASSASASPADSRRSSRQQRYEALASASDDLVLGSGDVEMMPSVHTAGPVDDQSTPKEVQSTVYQLRYTLLGAAMGIGGLTCFALQGADSYWILHSCWHVLMMAAAYCLLRGRPAFFATLGYKVPF